MGSSFSIEAARRVGDETVGIHAEEVLDFERDTPYERQSKLYPQFAEYQRRTKRTIPVFALTRK